MNPYSRRQLNSGRRAVVGDTELVAMMNRLEKKGLTKAIRAANSKAAKPIRQSMKKYARETSKTIAKSIGIKNKVYSRNKTGIVIIGIRSQQSVRREYLSATGKKRVHDPRFTGHLVEGGTQPHDIPAFGNKAVMVRHPGTKAKPFIKRALDENIHQARMAYASEIKSAVAVAFA
jgi:HK97 gp10 family phage protein